MKPRTTRIIRIILAILLVSFCILSSTVGVHAVPMESEQQKVQLDYQDPQKAETPSVFWVIVQTVMALCLILVLAWGMIRIFGGNMRGRMQGRYIRVLDEIVLGPNRGMAVVEVGGKAFIVGITEHQISVLGELDDSRVIEEMILTSLENPYASPPSPVTAWRYVKDKLVLGFHRKEQGPKFEDMVSQRMQALDRMSRRLRSLNNDNRKDDGWKNEKT